MIRLLDKDGNALVEVDEEKFPMRVVPMGETMVQERKLYINWTFVPVNGEKKRFIKSMNLGR